MSDIISHYIKAMPGKFMENTPAVTRERGAVALFACSMIYTSFGPLIRVLAEMFGLYTQVAARMGLAFLFLLTIGVIFKKIHRLSKNQILRSIILGVVSTSILVFFTIAITEIKLATTIFLLYAGNISASLFIGTTVFREKLGPQKIIAIALALLGLAIFMSSSIAIGIGVGTLAAILSGVSEGIGNGVRKGLTGADKVTVNIIQFFIITLCSTLLLFLSDETAIRSVSMKTILALVVFSILQLLLNHLLLYGFQNFDVNIGVVILSLEIFFTAIIAFFLFSESLSALEMIGGMTIFLASVISAWKFEKAQT